MEKTKLEYMDDTYQFEGEGILVKAGVGDKGAYFVCDKTVFYPQGGGQPSDTGLVRIEGISEPIRVNFVGFDTGHVLHFIENSNIDLEGVVGNKCYFQVDSNRRLLNSKLHTAGHLIAGIVDKRGGSLRAIKGFHFPEGPNVEFEGKYGEDPVEFVKALQNEVNECLKKNSSVITELVSYQELEARCPNIPSYLPKDKPLRIVTIGNFEPLPCGGTHVSSLAELGDVIVSKVKSKKGNSRVSYGLNDESFC